MDRSLNISLFLSFCLTHPGTVAHETFIWDGAFYQLHPQAMKAYQMETRIKEHFPPKKQSSGHIALQLKITRTAATQNYTCPKIFPIEHVKRKMRYERKKHCTTME